LPAAAAAMVSVLVVAVLTFWLTALVHPAWAASTMAACM